MDWLLTAVTFQCFSKQYFALALQQLHRTDVWLQKNKKKLQLPVPIHLRPWRASCISHDMFLFHIKYMKPRPWSQQTWSLSEPSSSSPWRPFSCDDILCCWFIWRILGLNFQVCFKHRFSTASVQCSIQLICLRESFTGARLQRSITELWFIILVNFQMLLNLAMMFLVFRSSLSLLVLFWLIDVFSRAEPYWTK